MIDGPSILYLVALWRALDSIDQDDPQHAELSRIFNDACDEQDLNIQTTRVLFVSLDGCGMLRNRPKRAT